MRETMGREEREAGREEDGGKHCREEGRKGRRGYVDYWYATEGERMWRRKQTKEAGSKSGMKVDTVKGKKERKKLHTLGLYIKDEWIKSVKE